VKIWVKTNEHTTPQQETSTFKIYLFTLVQSFV